MTGDPSPEPITFAFRDIPSMVGVEFLSPWLSVDLENTVLFDKATYYAAEEYGWDVASFPRSMIEGLHLLSLLPCLTNRALRLTDPSAFSLAYGFDRVRFVTPVYVGDKMRARGKVAEIKSHDEGFLMLKQCVVEVQGRERPGFVADAWTFILPRIRDELQR